MTLADTARLIGIIAVAYPNVDKYSEDYITAMTNFWAMVFANDDTNLVFSAVMKHISTSKWIPSIADIRSIMVDIQRPDLVPPDVAWGMVSDYIYAKEYEMFQSVYAEFPPIVNRAVEIVGFGNLQKLSRGHYGNSREGADRQAFMEVYVPMYERERQKAQIPQKEQEKLTEHALAYGGDSCAVYVNKAISAREMAKQKKTEFLNRPYRRENGA